MDLGAAWRHALKTDDGRNVPCEDCQQLTYWGQQRAPGERRRVYSFKDDGKTVRLCDVCALKRTVLRGMRADDG